MKNPIGWIEIPATDLDRAEQFYKDFLGLTTKRQPEMGGVTMSWFDMDMESYGSAATLIKGDFYTPSHDGPLVYFTAPEGSVEKGVEKAKEMGITIFVEKTKMGEHGYVAVVEDSEGNRIAIHSMEG